MDIPHTQEIYVVIFLNNIFHLYLRNSLVELSLVKAKKDQDRATTLNSLHTLASTASALHICILCVQRYGLWDHEGPLKEHSPSPEHCKDERKSREGDEDGRRKKGGGEDEEEKEGRVSSTSFVEKLEYTERDQLEKVGANT